LAVELTLADQARLVAALREVLGADTSVIETHISYVLLAGGHAYKIKKAVSLGFVDFSTLALRRHYCEEELRLNRRLAPAVYLDVVPIAGNVDRPEPGGEGEAIEYAVRMREFPQEALLSRELERGELLPQEIDSLAAVVAAFHARVAVARPGDGYGSPEDVLVYVRENFEHLDRLRGDPAERIALSALRDWTEREFAALRGTIEARLAGGFVREGHGDLHLGNIARVEGRIVVFDGIDFNAHLRWIDVASEIAFTAMDLEDRGRPDLAHRFVDAYLSITGDYAGLAVLRFYVVYRALVRAKVAALRADQLATAEARAPVDQECAGYVALARRHATAGRPGIVVTHGLSGSGKTTRSQAFLEQVGAVRLRTDVERKRLHGLAATGRSGSEPGGGLYGADATRATYERVCELARAVVASGRVAILDGTFLMRWQRDLARSLAAGLHVPFAILAFDAEPETLRRRILARSLAGSDASEADLAVLAHQLATREPPGSDEMRDVVACDAEAPLAQAFGPDAWRDVRERLWPPSVGSA
jgi:aminoglycoside phosphotransferase family enzyme/predicted kinase